MPKIPQERFPFCGPSYQAISPVIDAQASLNLFPEINYRSSKSPVSLIGRPGLALFGTLPTTPARALWGGHIRLFAAGGTHFYEVSNTGTVVTDFGAMAGSTGLGPCKIVQNAGGSAFQLGVLDTSSSQIYNAAGGAMTSVFNATAMEYLDGFQVAIATGASLAAAGNPNQVNSSAFGDLTTWPALNFIQRTDASDLTTQLAVLNGLLWVFGEKTITIFYNAGNPGFPFARVNGGSLNLGLLAPYSVVKFQNSIMWLGGDDTGYGQVYMAQGMNPVRVSNAAVETVIASLLPTSATNRIVSYGYQENGHTFYVMHFCTAGWLVNGTFVYDLTTGMWHMRDFLGSAPFCAASTAGFTNNQLFVGDANSGGIYYQNCIYPSDGGQAIHYIRRAPHICDSDDWVTYSRFDLSGDFGTAAPTLDYSDDGGRTFGHRTIPLRQAQDQGRGPVSPTFRRFYAQQLGRSRDRVFQMDILDSVNLIRIANAYITGEEAA